MPGVKARSVVFTSNDRASIGNGNVVAVDWLTKLTIAVDKAGEKRFIRKKPCA